jgi:precorrin-6B methylase 2
LLNFFPRYTPGFALGQTALASEPAILNRNTLGTALRAQKPNFFTKKRSIPASALPTAAGCAHTSVKKLVHYLLRTIHLMLNSPAGATPEPVATPPYPVIHWLEAGADCSARWRSERGSLPPKKVVLADDTMTADTAYRLACEGTYMLWRGDFHNARQLLQALARRIENTPARKRKKTAQIVPANEVFNRYRLTQSQRARLLNTLLVNFEADYTVNLRRAPDVKQACLAVWGAPDETTTPSVASLRELLGITSSAEWRRVGVEIPELGEGPDNRIFPHYGVFSPVRGEYIKLVATAHLPKHVAGQETLVAFDIGTGTGVLAAVLARRGVGKVVATDQEPRAIACARENLAQLGIEDTVELVQANLFPEGRADVVVCNPPWLPARPSTPIEHAVYDEGSRMLMGFLKALPDHLTPKGEGWLILSNLAEHLGLRTREELLAAFEAHGLRVVSRIDAKPLHTRAGDDTDPLYEARAKEVTSLWRLAAIKAA